MRLADFILANIEPILLEWEAFARSIPPGANMTKLALRNDAEDILRATVRDMKSSQSAAQRADKSKGHGAGGEESGLNVASDMHAVGRVTSGFDLMQVVAEYRALRASVIRLWSANSTLATEGDLDDLSRFNESIDQSLCRAVVSYTKHVDQAREMFLAILGHDLRNPLNSVAMAAAALSRTGKLDAESAEATSQISAGAHVMAQMISDLLDYTRTRLGAGMPTVPAAMDLGRLCREVFDEFHAAHPTRTLRFKSEGELKGEWDAARLRQAVSNLLANAIQHGDGSEPVELSLWGEADDVLMTVRNGGPPIPPEALPTIFDPLVRRSLTGPQRQRRPGSIGLGLYIAREVVTAHGGHIDVESTAQTGTTFRIHLPRAAELPMSLASPDFAAQLV